MHVFSPRRNRMCALALFCLPALGWSHAMPTAIAEDQTWRLWPDGVVYYELIEQASHSDPAQSETRRPLDAAARQVLLEAMQHIRQRTAEAVVFVPSTDHPQRVRMSLMPDHPDQHLCGIASVGYHSHATLQLTDRSDCKTRAVALHELMHTLGFLHENQRFQAIMDHERRPWARGFYADTREQVDHDSITYNDGVQGERLDQQRQPHDILLVRLRHGSDATGRWFQELSTQDVASIRQYYRPEQTLAGQLARAARERPDLTFQRLSIEQGQCLQTGAIPGNQTVGQHRWRELFVARCDELSPGQRWAFDRHGALHSLPYPDHCVMRLAETAHDARAGSHAALVRCRPGEPAQQWQQRSGQLVSQAQPHLSLQFDPQRRNVLVWGQDERLRSQWQALAVTTPGARPVVAAQAAAFDPWQFTLNRQPHLGESVLRLRQGEYCLGSAAGATSTTIPLSMQRCDTRRSLQWQLIRGRLGNVAHPGWCLDSSGEPARPSAMPVLQPCREGRRPQRWTIQSITGSAQQVLSTSFNALLSEDLHLLATSPDRQLFFARPRAPGLRSGWQIEPFGQQPAPAPRATEPGPTPHSLPDAAGRMIPLLGGASARQTAKQCLQILAGRPPGFDPQERGVGIADCDPGKPLQRWSLLDNGQLRSPALPGLCLGRNRARLGQERHHSYLQRGFRLTGYAAMQPCQDQAPDQQWHWRTPRYGHLGGGEAGAQLTLRDSPDLSLIVDGKAQGPQLRIGQADVADLFQFYRWQPTRAPIAMPNALGGIRALEWASPGQRWGQDAPGYRGQGFNMAGARPFRPLRWHDSQQCLSVRAEGVWRVVLATCQPGASEQRWRIDGQYRLINERHAQQCLLRQGNQVLLGDCRDKQALRHWFHNDSHQLDSLDQAPLRLRRSAQGDVVLDPQGYSGFASRWYWQDSTR
ncbi:hypothetical protein THUN1379_29540 [Paludibacterium sp. THUN1379]|nr:hypothetical protein THUN1379_29540 [Paludibacterium sp. THUN1379]